ncbi:MAG: DUF2924 domain-containing protein [Candidatus Schekmanbacteria bacterium]|nr:DUF2924 domain-containing protein [Candidatus Schekmanbacteria bacterium]
MLKGMCVADLREKYQEVFGEVPRSQHKDFLRKRIAWRIQVLAEGDLSERARRRAEELANDADLRIRAPKVIVELSTTSSNGHTTVHTFSPSHDKWLPMPGAVLTRDYQGEIIKVMVLDKGFEYEGRIYRSLTAVAKAVTGAHWNGFYFFGLREKGEKE